MHKIFLHKILVIMLFTSCKTIDSTSNVKEAPDVNNLASIFNVTPKKLKDTRTNAKLTKIPWSSSYWPHSEGGISKRWQTAPSGESYKDYIYPIHNMNIIKNMSQTELDQLSPSEKFDLWQNDENFSLTKAEHQYIKELASRGGRDLIPRWSGYCDGWAVSAITYKQPIAIVSVTSKLIGVGKKINFLPDDIKALISKANSYGYSALKITRIGLRCNLSSEKIQKQKEEMARIGQREESRCRDTNPATIHLILDDFINNNRPFIADIDDVNSVWNHPIIGYSFTHSDPIPLDRTKYPFAAQNTTHIVRVLNTFEYVDENSPSLQIGDIKSKTVKGEMKYDLELDKDGLIIGGEWGEVDEFDIMLRKLDFIWFVKDNSENLAKKNLKNIPGSSFSIKLIEDLLKQSAP